MKSAYSALTGVSISIIASALLLVLGTAKQGRAVTFTWGPSSQPIGHTDSLLTSQALGQLADVGGDREPEQTVCMGWDLINSADPFQGSCLLTTNALTLSQLSLFGESSLDYLSGISSKIVWSSQAGKKNSVAGTKGYVQVNLESQPIYKTLMDSKEPPSIIGLALLIAGLYALTQMIKNLMGVE